MREIDFIHRCIMGLKKLSTFFLMMFILQTAFAASDNSTLSLTAMSGNDGSSVDTQPMNPIVPQNTSHLFPKANAVQDAAFNSVARQAMPMTPKQIKRLKQMLTVTQQAAASPVDLPPTPVTSSIIVNLSPGSTPPVIRLSEGFISSLVFVDVSGEKWTIDGYDLGNPNAFNIQWQKNSNTLLVQATSMFTYGNLAVKLNGLATPVMLTLIPGQRSVDYRVDLHVQGRAPGAPAPVSQGVPSAASNQLLNVLNGISPPHAKNLEVTGASCDPSLDNCRAWLLHGKLYLRIPMDILSPGWVAKMQSSDGMRAYELDKTSSVLVSDYGKSMQLKIEGL